MNGYRFWGKVKPERDYRALNVATPRATEDATTATIRMYGPIDSWGGMWGVSAEEVSQALDSLPDTVSHIQLRINSPGGEGFEGLAILNMLRAHPATVTAIVDGLAASAASFIAAGCDETVMSPGTQMMIHDAWGLAIGNAGDMEKAKTFLNSVSDSIADLYAEAASSTRAKWRALMVAETWFTAKEAVTAGLADAVRVVPDLGVSTTAGAEAEADPTPGESDFDNSFDLSMFRYAGREQAPEPAAALQATGAPVASLVVQDVESADESAASVAAEAATDAADESADGDLMVTALASLHENAARFAFGG